jgi:hypothetical protein
MSSKGDEAVLTACFDLHLVVSGEVLDVGITTLAHMPCQTASARRAVIRLTSRPVGRSGHARQICNHQGNATNAI